MRAPSQKAASDTDALTPPNLAYPTKSTSLPADCLLFAINDAGEDLRSVGNRALKKSRVSGKA